MNSSEEIPLISKEVMSIVFLCYFYKQSALNHSCLSEMLDFFIASPP